MHTSGRSSPHRGESYLKNGAMDEESQQQSNVHVGVVLLLLDAQDAGWVEGTLLHCAVVPGEEAKLEEVLGDHHHLPTPYVSKIQSLELLMKKRGNF